MAHRGLRYLTPFDLQPQLIGEADDLQLQQVAVHNSGCGWRWSRHRIGRDQQVLCPANRHALPSVRHQRRKNDV